MSVANEPFVLNRKYSCSAQEISLARIGHCTKSCSTQIKMNSISKRVARTGALVGYCYSYRISRASCIFTAFHLQIFSQPKIKINVHTHISNQIYIYIVIPRSMHHSPCLPCINWHFQLIPWH